MRTRPAQNTAATPHWRRARAVQRVAFVALGLSTGLVAVTSLVVVGIILARGAGGLSWEFLTAMPAKGMRAGGIFPAIVGTLELVGLTIAFALPMGVASAIYLTEYAADTWVTRLVRLAIVNLSGVPSVVYGLFGLGLFVIFCRFGTSLLAGALTLAIMTLPVIITASEEALRSVPMSFREVSHSLGASRWQTVRHTVLPLAVPGIMTGTILGISRAAGETAPILFTVAAFYLPRLPQSVFDQAMVLPYHLYVISTQIPNIPQTQRYGTALVLVLLVLALNLSAVVLRARFRRRRQW
ncbi:MAG: phosphate ABC transporter permease PstA [Candidatus Omnitrophica bacterium]|nr:phosphate ABC transporter permease PstA [Candidatus Omnitrophota bacterium]